MIQEAVDECYKEEESKAVQSGGFIDSPIDVCYKCNKISYIFAMTL